MRGSWLLLLLLASSALAIEQESLSITTITEAELPHQKEKCQKGSLYFKLHEDLHTLPDDFVQELNSLSVALRLALPGFCFSLVKIEDPAQQQIQFELPQLEKTGKVSTPQLTSNADILGKMVLKEVFDIKAYSNEVEVDAFLNGKTDLHTPSLFITSKAFKEVAVELGGFLHQVVSHNQWFRFGVAFLKDADKYLKEHNAHSAVVTRSRYTDTQILTHTGHWGTQNVQAHLESASNPVIVNFDREESPSTVLGRNIPCLFMLGHHRDSQEFKDFEAVAQSLRNDILFVWADPQTGVSQRLIGFLKLSGEEIGNGVWLLKHHFGSVHKWKYPHPQITVSLVQKFIADYLANTVPRFQHSQPAPPEAENQGPVFTAVGNTYKQLVFANDMNVIVDFYGIYCGHCVTFAPIYEELAREMKELNIRFVKIEMSQNEVETETIYQFPTIKLYPAKRKDKPIQFEGPRNKEAMLDFIKKNMDQVVENQDI